MEKVNKKIIFRILNEIEESRIPSSTNLWPGIHYKLVTSSLNLERRQRRIKNGALLMILAISASLIFVALWAKMSPAAKQVAGMPETTNTQTENISPGLLPESFVEFQPGYIPNGFSLSLRECHLCQPGSFSGLQSIQARRKDDQVPDTTPTWRTSEPPEISSRQEYSLWTYNGPDSQRFTLFERKAEPGETLPPGAPITISGQQARYQTNAGQIKVTLIASGTWIEIEGTVPLTDMKKIAENLREIQPLPANSPEPDR